LSIKNEGKQILGKIDSIAAEQVMKALMRLPANSLPEQILGEIRAYAAVLKEQQLDGEVKTAEAIIIINGYRTVLLGRCLEKRM
jgi:hypothetical protein